MEACSEEALKLVWEGAIPLQIFLHESEVTTLPAPPPAIVLGPRIGYLPLLIPLIKPHFSSTLPPGVDSIWFDYEGLPLKWYIPTGVLFDLLCADPERPWNLTVHFRGYPGEILNPCEGEDSVKWSFINSLKEAAYIINGNCKNVMNMSQADQFELWQSLVKGNMDSYRHISSKLKLGPLGKDCLVRTASSLVQSRQSFGETDNVGSNRAGRIPVRLYVRTVDKDLDDLEDVAAVDSWDSITYINRPLEIYRQDGNYITLKSAIKTLLPEFFDDETSKNNQSLGTERDYHESDSSLGETDAVNIVRNVGEEATSSTSQTEMQSSKKAKIKLIRIQGVELDSNIPFCWVVNNLMHPEYYLHICVFLGGLAH